MNSIEYGRFEFQRLAFFMIHAVYQYMNMNINIKHEYEYNLVFLLGM